MPKQPKTPKPGPSLAVNTMDLARQLGVSAGTVKSWKSIEGNPGADGSGRYRVDDWWVQENEEMLKGAGGPNSKSEWEIEKLKKQVERMDMELKVRRGELVSVEDVLKWAAQMAHACKAELLSIPGKAAPQILGMRPADAERRLREMDK